MRYFLESNRSNLKKKTVLLVIIFFLAIAATTSFINLCSAANKGDCHKKYADCAYKPAYLVENNKSFLMSFWVSQPLLTVAKQAVSPSEPPITHVEFSPHIYSYSRLIKSIHPPKGPPAA